MMFIVLSTMESVGIGYLLSVVNLTLYHLGWFFVLSLAWFLVDFATRRAYCRSAQAKRSQSGSLLCSARTETRSKRLRGGYLRFLILLPPVCYQLTF
jgi:hypothetical protein